MSNRRPPVDYFQQDDRDPRRQRQRHVAIPADKRRMKQGKRELSKRDMRDIAYVSRHRVPGVLMRSLLAVTPSDLRDAYYANLKLQNTAEERRRMIRAGLWREGEHMLFSHAHLYEDQIEWDRGLRGVMQRTGWRMARAEAWSRSFGEGTGATIKYSTILCALMGGAAIAARKLGEHHRAEAGFERTIQETGLRLPELPFRPFGQVDAPLLSSVERAQVDAALEQVNADDFDALLGPNHKRVCLEGTFVAVDFMHDQQLFTGSRAGRSAQQNVRLGVALANLESGCNPYLMAGGNTTREDIAGGATQFLENEWAIKMMTMRGPLGRLAPDSAALNEVLTQVDVMVDAYKDHLRERANLDDKPQGSGARLTDAERQARVDLERLAIFEANAILPAAERRDGFTFGGANDIYREAFNYATRHSHLAHARDVVRDARLSNTRIETQYGIAEMGMVLGEVAALRGADEVPMRADFIARVAVNMQVRAPSDELQMERAEAIAVYGDHQRGRTRQGNLIDCYMGTKSDAFCRRTLAWRAADNRSLYMRQDNQGRWHELTTVQPVLNNMEAMLGAGFAEAAGALYAYRHVLSFTDVPSTAIHPRRDAEGREVRVAVTDIGYSLVHPAREQVAGGGAPRGQLGSQPVAD